MSTKKQVKKSNKDQVQKSNKRLEQSSMMIMSMVSFLQTVTED